MVNGSTIPRPRVVTAVVESSHRPAGDSWAQKVRSDTLGDGDDDMGPKRATRQRQPSPE